MVFARQTTLRERVDFDGVGVHSGQACRLTLLPAPINSGISVMRSDHDFADIPATHAHVTSAELSTVIGDPAKGGVATVEHILSALYGLGIDNALIEVDGPEVPILDGSTVDFVRAIDAVGIVVQAAPRRFIKVLKPVRVTTDFGSAELLPAAQGLRLEVEIDFASQVIGRQVCAIDLSPQVYREGIAGARTFGFMADVERLWAMKRALGASLDNTVVVGDDKVMNPEGLRFDDEFVRHKMLDAIGDLALAGAPLVGRFRSRKGGHKLNVMVLAALFADPANYALVERPVVARRGGMAEMGLQQAAYKAEAS